MIEKRTLGIVMDPIQNIYPKKDTSLALLLKAQSRGFELYYLEIKDLSLKFGQAFGQMAPLTVFDSTDKWFSLGEKREHPLDQLDVILMRKDPPVDMEYIYATYILERAESNGTIVVNKPQTLRDANEKMYTTWFPQCMPPTVVSASLQTLKQFIIEHQTVVVKPLAGMGGHSIFKCQMNDPNLNVILETITQLGKRFAMVQQFIPDIEKGDKRIFLIGGEPIPFALARIPKTGEFRGNLAVGGKGKGVELTERDYWICSQVGPILREKGLLFVGLDVIGDYLTEINITSPTCVREVEAIFEIDIAGQIIDSILFANEF